MPLIIYKKRTIMKNESLAQKSQNSLFSYLESISKKFNVEGSKLNKELKGTYGYTNAIVRFRSDDNLIYINVNIKDGKIHVDKIIDDKYKLTNGSTIIFDSKNELKKLLSKDDNPDDLVKSILSTEVRIEGNPAHFAYLSYLLSLINPKQQIDAIRKGIENDKVKKFDLSKKAGKPSREMFEQRFKGRLHGENTEAGVRWLDDPYLPEYSLDNFCRLLTFRKELHGQLPEITSEQGELLTKYYQEVEDTKEAEQHVPDLRMAKAYKFMMENRTPVLRNNDLLAGTMTPNPICGSVTQPYTIGWSIWGELNTMSERELDKFSIKPATIKKLHNTVFPYWMNRHVQQKWKEKSGYPLAAKVFDRMFFYVPWGVNSLNPGSPGFDTIVKIGIRGFLNKIDKEQEILNSQEKTKKIQEKLETLEAMKTALDGVLAYSKKLRNHLAKEAEKVKDLQRKNEILNLVDILGRIPEEPAKTLHEGLQMIWIIFIGIGLESMDDDISVGRLDQILQPMFQSDMEKLQSEEERKIYIKNTIELVGCFFYRLASHRIAGPTLASWQNSGAPSVSSITVGGVTPDGTDAVNDMTYIILKVTEMLSLDDPDMDARHMPGVNSSTYLKRVCEVNYITSGTPSIYNDETVMRSLGRHLDWSERDIRNWVPCGCVEPVISGKHFAATGDIDTNLMVPLYMAMHNGNHYKWNLTPSQKKPFGPKTGNVEDFKTFDEFFRSFEKQFHFIYSEMITGGSYKILEAQQEAMPCSLYSALLDGCIEKGKVMTHVGAKYNTSGTSYVGLSDVIDSLLAIKSYVYDNKRGNFKAFKQAVDANFEAKDENINKEYRKIYSFARYTADKFGSNSDEAKKMADRVTGMIASFFHKKDNHRGGDYSTGYRSNNNHTVFGNYSKASPSGRLSKAPYTSGLTPTPWASKNLQDNLIDVGNIRPEHADNCYTFNVRLSFSKKDSHAYNINLITQYVEAYFKFGGMQVQFNMVDADTLKDAMANPEYYPNLIARVSGYTGYYTKMHKNLQLEIIGRTQFDI